MKKTTVLTLQGEKIAMGLDFIRAVIRLSPLQSLSTQAQMDVQFAVLPVTPRSKMRTQLLTILSALLLVGCGPSNEEIRNAALSEMKTQMEQIQLLERKIKETNENLQNHIKIFDELSAQIVVEQTKLKELQGFRFLRSVSEKEEQIKEQVKTVQQMAKEKDRLAKLIRQQERSLNGLREQKVEVENEVNTIQ